MRIRTLLLALAVLLAAVPPQAFAFVSENPRQGVAPISAEFGPNLAQREAGSHLGFPLRFLEILVRNGFRHIDPFGLDYRLVSGDPAIFSAAEARLRESPTGAAVLDFMKKFPGMINITLDPGTDPQILTRRGMVGLPREVATGQRDYTSCDNDIPMVIFLGAKNIKVGLKWQYPLSTWIALELGHEGAHVKEPTLHEERGDGSPTPGVYEKYERTILKDFRDKGLLKK